MNITDLLAADPVAAYSLTLDRIVATAGALIALAGTVAGVLVRRNRRRNGTVALAAGAVGVVVGALIIVTADGGPGTGNGIVGGYVAVVLGLAAAALGLRGVTRRT
ncbi:DUF6223 family protein [Dactylosporangium sucinum]|uniref:Uncharacterized protein n=1 Tax=Dactylosporangium sucinum TaxID=1424081 RepID=A0A917U0A6_9ACTN|nr:DUF6223 family protein [Dactylosporangium sucinum]GGM47792.1 hypothetical protein GCM10007977_056780 [Dactylosporangium sucinum]